MVRIISIVLLGLFGCGMTISFDNPPKHKVIYYTSMSSGLRCKEITYSTHGLITLSNCGTKNLVIQNAINVFSFEVEE